MKTNHTGKKESLPAKVNLHIRLKPARSSVPEIGRAVQQLLQSILKYDFGFQVGLCCVILTLMLA